MAKPELLAHVKLGRLMRALGLRKYEAVGILECLWQHCYQCTDDGVGTAADVAWIVDWPAEDADRLTDALAACGWLDPDPDPDRPGGWTVHDLWQHAPRYARRRFAREVKSEQDSNLVSWPPEPNRTEPEEKEQRLSPLPQPVDLCGKPARVDEPVNPRVLQRLCYELGLEDCSTWSDAAEALKRQAARYRVPYTGQAVTRALTTVAYARASPLRALVRRKVA